MVGREKALTDSPFKLIISEAKLTISDRPQSLTPILEKNISQINLFRVEIICAGTALIKSSVVSLYNLFRKGNGKFK